MELKLVEIRDNQYMSDLYPDGLPSNAIIDKTLTAKGATTCELDERYAKRNSIIIEPNVPVIDSKQVKYPNLLGVREGVTDYDVKKYLLDKSIRYKKIIVTPESYSRLCKLNCVMLYSHSISSVGERPAPRGGTTRPDERKITII